MKRMLIILASAAIALGHAAPSHAISAKSFNCEKSLVNGLTSMARAEGKCMSTCINKKQSKPAGTYSCRRDDFAVPPLQLDALTQACVDKAETKFVTQVVAKCTGVMPECGGYRLGYCSNNVNLTCSTDLGDCGVGNQCRGRCSTAMTSCDFDSDCPVSETCDRPAGTKAPGVLAADTLTSASGQVQSTSETLFGCRQRLCSGSADLCATEDNCPMGESCKAGKCSGGSSTLCDVDGECGAGKKCLPLGRCTVATQTCLTDTDCGIGGGTCKRYGRCSDQTICFADTDCSVGTCNRTLVDTDRKAELKCTKGVTDALGKLSFDVSNCQSKCALDRDVKAGTRCTNNTSVKCVHDEDCGVGGECRPMSCDPFAIGRCSVTKNQVCSDFSDCPMGETCNDTTPDPIDQKLADCRDLAVGKAIAFINAKCPSLPACGAFSQFGGLIGFKNTPELLIEFVNGAQDGQFKEDNPDQSPGSNFCQP